MDALDNPDNNTAQNQTSIIPTTTSGKPIEYDGNPAHLAGILHELEQFFIRTKHFEPFIQHGACLLSNGKTAVDSKESAKFISMGLDVRSFQNMCPDTAARITAFNTAGAAMTPPLAWVPITAAEWTEISHQYAVNPFKISSENGAFCRVLLSTIKDGSSLREFTTQAAGDGRRLLDLLKAESRTATAADRALALHQ